MPLVHGTSKEAVSENISRLRSEKYPERQAVAIALDVARKHRAAGGFDANTVEDHLPITKPKEGRLHTGPIRSPVAGRTDHLPMKVRANSYVLPADVVSGLGENNTEAGHRIVEHIFPPKPRADGGAVDDDEDGIEIVAAGGEHVLSPEQVTDAGGGDVKKGHDVLDKFVKKVRAKNIKTLKGLPGPVKE